jgi:hypothetical protein
MKILRALFLAAAAFAFTAGVQANVISGSLWRVPEAVSQNAVLANVPATTPDVVFDLNSPIDCNATNQTIGFWLGTCGAFNVVENTAGTLSALMDNSVLGSLLYFTGLVTVANGQQFTVTHDDGLTLIIGGIDLGFNPLPTPPITSLATYNGPSGTFGFQLVYTECCGGPAVLQIDLPFTFVPEPGALALLGLGLAALGLARRRKQ